MRNVCIALVVLCFGCSKSATQITLQEAKTIASDTYHGELISANKDDSNQRSVYHIEMKVDGKNYHIIIDASNGDILSDSIIESKPSTSDKDTNKQTISEQEAKEIALQRTKGGEITKIEFDKADDAGEVDTYDIDIIKDTKEYELSIDAYTGEILTYEEETLRR